MYRQEIRACRVGDFLIVVAKGMDGRYCVERRRDEGGLGATRD